MLMLQARKLAKLLSMPRIERIKCLIEILAMVVYKKMNVLVGYNAIDGRGGHFRKISGKGQAPFAVVAGCPYGFLRSHTDLLRTPSIKGMLRFERHATLDDDRVKRHCRGAQKGVCDIHILGRTGKDRLPFFKDDRERAVGKHKAVRLAKKKDGVPLSDGGSL